jgi:DNA polymerase
MTTPPTTDADASGLHSLSLDPRQRAMLQAMGVTVWWPEPTTVPAGAETQPGAVHAAGQRRSTSEAESPRQESAEGQFSSKNSLPIARAPAPPTQAQAPAQVPAWEARTDVSGMDWAQLTDAIAHCQACGLCQGRRQAVPGMGPQRARWMVVGEAPGEQEDKQGLPFVGPAGQLLDAMLAAMGLTREADVYIANVIKCRPPHNRNPDPAEVAQCQPYLRRQIELVQPDLILALGKFAAQTLLAGVVPDVDKLPLGKLRGQVHQVHGTPVVVSYHPAYLLRSPLDKAKTWFDLCLAMEHLGYNPLAPTPP